MERVLQQNFISVTRIWLILSKPQITTQRLGTKVAVSTCDRSNYLTKQKLDPV